MVCPNLQVRSDAAAERFPDIEAAAVEKIAVLERQRQAQEAEIQRRAEQAVQAECDPPPHPTTERRGGGERTCARVALLAKTVHASPERQL